MFDTVPSRSAFRYYIPAVVAAWFFYKHFVKPFLSPLRKIPGCPYRPIVGNMLESMREGANNNGLRWMQKYQSKIIRFYFIGGEGAVLVGDPAMVKQILVTNSKNYFRGNNRFLSTLTPGFLALTSGEEHHALRRLVNPVFNTRAVEGFIPVFERTVRKVVKAWLKFFSNGVESAEINAQDYMSRLTLDAICECGFDYDMKALEDDQNPKVQTFKNILGRLELSVLQILSLNWLSTKNSRQLSTEIQLYRSTISQVITEKQNKLHEGLASNDILSLLLQARDENGRPLSEENLYSQVGGFMLAGFETTNMALTWTLLCLGEHPDVQEKVRQEVLSILPDKEQTITPKIVESLTYLTCVINESLRLHTPISTVFRRSLHEDYLGNYLIPAGTLVGINLGALHRLQENWPDPLTFKPERFQEEYDRYSFLPFGAGPYMCIGHLFSMAETKITLALLLRNFKISLPSGYKYKVIRKVAIQPKPPLKLIISPL